MEHYKIKYFHDLLQGSEEWDEIRRGRLTASKMKELITPTLKIASNDKVRALNYEIAAQRITHHVEDNYQSWDMERGHIEEDIARDLYSDNHEKVTECGFIINRELGFDIGFSPDGLVGNEGLIEIKSIIQKHQVKTIVDNIVPKAYMMQIQTGLFCTRRKWCDFISFSNGMPLFVKRVYPDAVIFEKIKEASELFELTVNCLVEEYKANSENLVQHVRVEHDRDDVVITASEVK
jgi:hypothetical protein